MKHLQRRWTSDAVLGLVVVSGFAWGPGGALASEPDQVQTLALVLEAVLEPVVRARVTLVQTDASPLEYSKAASFSLGLCYVESSLAAILAGLVRPFWPLLIGHIGRSSGTQKDWSFLGRGAGSGGAQP